MSTAPPLPTGDAKASAVRSMFDRIAPRYDLVNRLMTFGMDRSWRRQAVASLTVDVGATVIDVACGTGDLCRVLARAGYRPVGIDVSAGMLAHARTSAPLVHGDGLCLPFADGKVDGAVSGFALRNFVALDPLLDELARVLRRGGRIALLDVATPANPAVRAGHAVYFGRVVPRIGGLLSDGAAYRYLPQSVAYLPPVADLLDLVRAAGFEAVERRLLSGGISQLITATRR
ncbi:MAG: ubiquinone/menaquinone biosynthesis methyltransferase [Actinomycetota bacterium]|nr:ubiquinone/menaquinone biosynthesis methyltransferase [Actinomycetota bacterium]MDQ6944871.1 ubiquinone/menaquinone biosynthesis methyltransferase [Actinomycetota bacterium]